MLINIQVTCTRMEYPVRHGYFEESNIGLIPLFECQVSDTGTLGQSEQSMKHKLIFQQK